MHYNFDTPLGCDAVWHQIRVKKSYPMMKFLEVRFFLPLTLLLFITRWLLLHIIISNELWIAIVLLLASIIITFILLCNYGFHMVLHGITCANEKRKSKGADAKG